jgi:predicted dehydrogenase
MNKIRTAILGCGQFAHRHAQNLVSLETDISLVAFSDHHIENAIKFRELYTHGKAEVYEDFRDLIEDAGLDLLVVTVPPFAHCGEVELAASRGIHVFVEKPIALSSDRAWRMVDAVESADVKSQVGFMFRFGEAVEYVKLLINAGSAGEPGLMSARYFCNSLHTPWWRDRNKSGGQLVEQVIHMIDLMRYLMGEPVSVFSRQENIFHKNVSGYTNEDVSATIYSFSKGALGVIYATNGAVPGKWINDYRYVAEKLTVDFFSANQANLFFTEQDPVGIETIKGNRNIYLYEMLDLIQAIKTGSQTRTPIREGALSLDMALGANKSAETRQEVLL